MASNFVLTAGKHWWLCVGFDIEGCKGENKWVTWVIFGMTLKKKERKDAFYWVLIVLNATSNNQNEFLQFFCHSKDVKFADIETQENEKM